MCPCFADNQKTLDEELSNFNAVVGENKDDKQQPDKKEDKNAHHL